MRIESIEEQLERDIERLDDSIRPAFQGLYYLIKAQSAMIEQIHNTQGEQQKLIREMYDNLTKLMARYERFSAIEEKCENNAEEISRIRGVLWTVAVLMPPASAIIGSIIAIIVQKLMV